MDSKEVLEENQVVEVTVLAAVKNYLESQE